jgi:hypothetical protein
MAGKLGAVVEGDGPAERLRDRAEQVDQMAGDAVGRLAGEPGGQQQAGLAVMHGEDGLAVFGEHHQVGFPMTAGLAVIGLGRPFCHGNTAFNEARGAAAPPAATAAPALAARQVAPPAVVPGAGELGVDEAVDGLMADHLAALVARQTAGDLLGRPSAGEPLEHGGPQALIALQPHALPASGTALLVGVTGAVSDLRATIALQLPRNR